ncbi:hypothetical protein Dimus_023462 [Dionaea muscipula]
MANYTFRIQSKTYLYPQTDGTKASKFHPTLHFADSHLFPSKSQFKFRSFYGIKLRENGSKNKGVSKTVSCNPVDELDRPISVSASENQFEHDDVDGEKGFDGKWPLWKNLPPRYKLIGITSLAFVICNMDKIWVVKLQQILRKWKLGWMVIESSFFWGYALSQLPGGWLAKIVGGRLVFRCLSLLFLIMYWVCVLVVIGAWHKQSVSGNQSDQDLEFIGSLFSRSYIFLMTTVVDNSVPFGTGVVQSHYAIMQVLATGVLVWSFATALVPVLAGFMPGLVFSRILVGIGEGVSPSAATDLIARHVTNPLVPDKVYFFCLLLKFSVKGEEDLIPMVEDVVAEEEETPQEGVSEFSLTVNETLAGRGGRERVDCGG